MDHAHDYTRVGAFNIIVSSIAEEVPGLTDEEKRQLEAVMRKAKEFDAEEENKMKKPLEGQLYKYTNVVKGWQYRWFVLTPETGMLEYYMMDEIKKHRPRGALHLAGAVISPSDEDNQSFNVSAVCGEVYKLKANDSKERHFWVNRLRLAAEHHSKIGPEKPVAVCKESSSTSLFIGDAPLVNSSFISYSAELTGKKIPQTVCDVQNISSCKGIPVIENIPTLNDSLASIKESLEKAISNQKSLAKNIEDLPIDGPYIKCSDIALLLLKATSLAAVQSLEQCYLILRQRQLAITQPSGLPPGATVEWVDKSKPLNVNKSPAKKMTDALPKLP